MTDVPLAEAAEHWPPREPAAVTGTPVTFEDVRLLLESVHALSGLDFRGYAYSSIRRRIARAILETATGSIAGLHQKIKESPLVLERLAMLIEQNPDLRQVVEIAAEAEADATALERLRFRRRQSILLISPFLAAAGMAT